MEKRRDVVRLLSIFDLNTNMVHFDCQELKNEIRQVNIVSLNESVGLHN